MASKVSPLFTTDFREMTSRTGQAGPGQDRTGQDGTGRDGTGRDGTGQDRTMPQIGRAHV